MSLALSSNRPRVALLAAVLLVCAAPAIADDDDETVDSTEPAPEHRWDEQQEVRVVLGETASVPLGASSTHLEPTEEPGMPSDLTEVVVEVPGVSENGQGGLLQTFSIRGVARQRVLNLVSGMRITSERRAGVSTSFIDPTLMGSVEVLRGPATTFYGSGALGGVVQVMPARFSGWTFATGYDSNGDENFQTFGIGADGWSVGVARRQAQDGESADGTRLNSHFTQYSAVLGVEKKRGGLRFAFLVIPTYAEDIGKANTDYPERTTNYPYERHQLVKFTVDSDKGWRVHSFVHAHDLETEVVEGSEQSNVSNDTTDLGVRWESDRDAGGAELRYGVDGFGRRGVDAEETQRDLDSGDRHRFSSIDDAKETELGGFGSARWKHGDTSWEIGGRYSWIEQENEGDPERDRSAVNAFAGLAHSFTEKLELRGSLASGTRFPSLTEQFFTGTTGRGEVVGNPSLDEERSLNAEISTRWIGRSIVVNGVVFHNEIDDYIERVEIEPDLLTFVNLTSGTIQGFEAQGVWHPLEPLSLSFGGHLIEGEDDDGNALADTPPNEVYLGATHRIGRWRTDARLTLRAERNDPGSGEKPIPSAELLAASASYGWSNGWEITVGGTNLLDEEYFASADRKAAPAPGRAFTFHLIRRGG